MSTQWIIYIISCDKSFFFLRTISNSHKLVGLLFFVVIYSTKKKKKLEAVCSAPTAVAAYDEARFKKKKKELVYSAFSAR